MGELLLDKGFFNAEGAATAQLLKDEGRYQLQLAVNPAVVESTLLAIEVGLLASAIAENTLDGRPLEVTLNDETLKPVKVVPPPTARARIREEFICCTPTPSPSTRPDVLGTDSSRLQFSHLIARGWSTLARENEGIYQLRFVVQSGACERERIGQRIQGIRGRRRHGGARRRDGCRAFLRRGDSARYTVSASNRRRARDGSDRDSPEEPTIAEGL